MGLKKDVEKLKAMFELLKSMNENLKDMISNNKEIIEVILERNEKQDKRIDLIINELEISENGRDKD